MPAYVGLGSNVGDRRAFLAFGLNALLNSRRVDLRGLSGIYETVPVGGPKQDSYLNAVALLSTTLSAQELLELTVTAEDKAGRRREGEEKWGPRKLDIDILAHGDEVISTPELTIPHPRIYEREFVLVPLFDVGLVGGTSIEFDRAEEALRRLRGTQGVVLVEPPDWL